MRDLSVVMESVDISELSQEILNISSLIQNFLLRSINTFYIITHKSNNR